MSCLDDAMLCTCALMCMPGVLQVLEPDRVHMMERRMLRPDMHAGVLLEPDRVHGLSFCMSGCSCLSRVVCTGAA